MIWLKYLMATTVFLTSIPMALAAMEPDSLTVIVCELETKEKQPFNLVIQPDKRL